jgi:hypothetical protein
MFAGSIETICTFDRDWSATITEPTTADVSYSLSPSSGHISGSCKAFVYAVWKDEQVVFGCLLQGDYPAPIEECSVTITDSSFEPPYVQTSVHIMAGGYGYAGSVLSDVSLGPIGGMEQIPSDYSAFCSTVFKNSQIRAETFSRLENIKFSGSFVTGGEGTYEGNLALKP